MRASQIDKVIAAMEEERLIVQRCIDLVESMPKAVELLSAESAMISACIGRLRGQIVDAPKPVRTRKGRKVTEPSL